MHVVVSKKDLLRVLARCQGVANRKSTMPMLGNVLLEVTGPDALRLAATDLYLAITATIQAEVSKGGSIAVGARDLFERVRMMPDGQIAIESGANASTTVRGVGTKRRYTLHGIPGEDFPKLPEPDPAVAALTLPVHVMGQLIAATHFSIATDETRLHLNSALFESEPERVRMVTTDGHRLSKMEVSVAGVAGSSSMLVPLKGVLELKRICDEALSEAGKAEADPQLGATLKMVQSGPNAFFQIGGLRFSVKVVDAQFPPYQQVIPENTARSVVAPRHAVADALRAVSVAANDRTGGVKLTLSQGTMRFESESPESGEGYDEIPVDYDGSDMTIGFNARYFLEVLAATEDENVEIGISGELDPAVIMPAGRGESSSYLAVVMPMRI